MNSLTVGQRFRLSYIYWLKNYFGGMSAFSYLVNFALLLGLLHAGEQFAEVFAYATITFTFAWVGWKGIHLLGSEGHQLIPQYTERLLRQQLILLLFSCSLVIITLVVYDAWTVLGKLSYAVLTGCLVLLVCIFRSHWYNSVYLLILLVNFGISMLPEPEIYQAFILIVLSLGILYQYSNWILKADWDPRHAATHDLSMRTGWQPTVYRLNALTTLLNNKVFFPLIYLSGSAVTIFLIVWLVFAVALVSAVYWFQVDPADTVHYMALTQMMTIFYLCWGIVKNAVNWPSILLLPIYKNFKQMLNYLFLAKCILLFLGFLIAQAGLVFVYKNAPEFDYLSILFMGLVQMLAPVLSMFLLYRTASMGVIMPVIFLSSIGVPVSQQLAVNSDNVLLMCVIVMFVVILLLYASLSALNKLFLKHNS